ACSTPCPGSGDRGSAQGTRRQRACWESVCCCTVGSWELLRNLVRVSFTAAGPGGALVTVGEALQQVAQAKDALDVNVKHGFIEPLQELHSTELTEIRHQLKKLNGRRLDFDYKRRRRGKIPADELQQAWDKFLASKELAEQSMFVLLQNDVDQLGRLAALVSALHDFHCNAHRILLGVHGNLQARLTAASNKPERRFRPRKVRVRREQNSSIGFYQQLSITAANSSGWF
uniref:SH3-domain GRB2-like 3b n=1 Tax=Mastacembelus armatus TaxID=205130 RepID=A0A3Q3MMF4_9TELE